MNLDTSQTVFAGSYLSPEQEADQHDEEGSANWRHRPVLQFPDHCGDGIVGHQCHVEAKSAVNGIGLVKLMGCSTGHIALHATLSCHDIDYCLIPENDFYLEGNGGMFKFLDQWLRQNGHVVLIIVERASRI
ncbi:hypothetical protein Taro_032608 [Colocasia esculenta]|uniref:Uncharacterized protein n=1 Tax=Colocasia esculenta TaxID=4460 RepID=A0A843VT33_COLES|nr:hypothetical protein [Colocasia esculenta]